MKLIDADEAKAYLQNLENMDAVTIDKGYRCSLCGQNSYINSPFCPNCGTKMEV